MKTQRTGVSGVLGVLLLLSATACKKDDVVTEKVAPLEAPAEVIEPASLYDRMGGQPAVEQVADEFVNRLAADPRTASPAVKSRLAKADPIRMRVEVAAYICQAAEGPCTYDGRELKDAHQGLHLTDAQFDAGMDDLGKALQAALVPAPERDELLRTLAAYRTEMVEAAATPAPATR
jgi:hemoglobin